MSKSIVRKFLLLCGCLALLPIFENCGGGLRSIAGSSNNASLGGGGGVQVSVQLSTSVGDSTGVTPIPFAIVFGQPVTTFNLANLIVTNGTASNLAGSGANYTFSVTPVTAGTVTVVMPAGIPLDPAGDVSSASNALNVTYTGTQQAPVLKTDNGCSLNLPGDCDSPVAAYSLNGRIVSAYSVQAPLFTVVRIPDLATTPVLQPGQGSYAPGNNNPPDTTQISAWLASGPPNSFAIVTTVFDQSGHQNDATQANLGSAPKLHIDSAGPAASALSLVFSNDMASSQASYASTPSNGSNLSIQSLTNTDPTTITYAPSGTPSYPNFPAGAPFPQLPPPNYWIIPGFLVQDKSLPTAGIPVLTSNATTLVLQGQPVEVKDFSKSLTITPPNVFLDMPAGVAAAMNAHTMMAAVRTGISANFYYMTLGQSGETAMGASPYSSFYSNTGAYALVANDSTIKHGNIQTPIVTTTASTEINVYEVARNGGTVFANLDEVGSSSIVDNFPSTVGLTGGSIGFTQQIKGPQGAFEGYGFMVFPSALSTNDASVIQQTMKSFLNIPTPLPVQVVYTGASTVVGHGIDSVEAPAKHMGLDLAAQNIPVRTYTISDLSNPLLNDLQSGGPLTNLYNKNLTNILVIHPTVSDSFNAYESGNWPSPLCGNLNSIPVEQCLWLTVSATITAAHNMGWKIVLLGTEPKASFIEGGGSELQSFLNFKGMEVSGYAALGADVYFDLESNPYFGGTDGKGGISHCPFWRSACIPGYVDPNITETHWQPDGDHFTQLNYDLSADLIVQVLLSNNLIPHP